MPEELARIAALEQAGKVVVPTRTDRHVTLANPDTRSSVKFYPAHGIVVRNNVRQFRRGLDAALKLIGVAA